MSTDCWYFAYGSNLLVAQFHKRTEPLRTGDEAPRRATLAHYDLTFNVYGENGHIYANIVPGPGPVLGVVYRLNPASMKRLDVYERGYARASVIVTDEHGTELTATVYIARPKHTGPPGPPKPTYLKRILDGASQHGLPPEYIEHIRTLASVSSPA